MGNKRNRYWGLVLFMLVLSASLLAGRASAQNTFEQDPAAQTQPAAGGAWVLDKTDIEKNIPKNPNAKFLYEISSGGGTSRVEEDFPDYHPPCKGTRQSAHAWTPLPTTLIPGQTISIKLEVSVSAFSSPRDCDVGHWSATTSFSGDRTRGSSEAVRTDDHWLTTDDPDPVRTVTYDWKVPEHIPSFKAPLMTSFKILSGGLIGSAEIIYTYKWQESATGTTTSIPWQVVVNLGGLLGAGTGVLVAGGVLASAVANILSINRENRTKAAQDSQQEQEEQDPKQVVGYILQLSSDAVMLTPQQPASVSAAVWQVTADGATARAPDSAIRVDIPGTSAGFLQVTPTSGQGQINCNFTQVGQPAQGEVLVTFNASAAQGGALTQVKVTFEVELAISSSQPVIRYYTGDKRWGVPDLAVYFHAPGDNTPVRVPFQYGFPDPNAIFTAEPDILEQEDAQPYDDGLTWQVKMKLKEGVDLEKVFGKDLTGNDGKVTIKVTVVRQDAQKVNPATTTYQLRPEVTLFVYGCFVHDPSNRTLDKRNYQNVELDEMEFAADGTDQLELGAVFLRTDKELEPGNEYAERASVATIKQAGWKGAEEAWGFNPPEVDDQAAGEDCFGYRISTKRPFLATDENLGRKPTLHFEAELKASAPRTYSILASSLDVKLAPQCLYLKLIVVPSEAQNRATAVAYVCLTKDANTGLAGIELFLDVEPTGGVEFLVPGIRTEKTNSMGLATWELPYKPISWQDIEQGKAQCKVHCGIIKEERQEPAETTWLTIDLRANFRKFTQRFQADAGKINLTNPLFQTKGGFKILGLLWPDSLTGPINNFRAMCGNKLCHLYTCGQMRNRIWDWAINHRYSANMGTRMEMNGIEFARYTISGLHVFFGFYPSGQPFNSEDPWFLDPWWDQAHKPDKIVLTWTDEAAKAVGVGLLFSTVVIMPGGGMALWRTLGQEIVLLSYDVFVQVLTDYLIGAFLLGIVGTPTLTAISSQLANYIPKLERTTDKDESGFTDGRSLYWAHKDLNPTLNKSLIEAWRTDLQWTKKGFPKVYPVTKRQQEEDQP